MYIGIILLLFRIEGNIPEAKKIGGARMSFGQMSLFHTFKFLIGILFGQSFLSCFKKEIISETSILSVGAIKKDSVFTGGR